MDYESVKYVISKRLSEKRYKHSLGVAEIAEKLARKYGEDEKTARMAGILHDVTKELSEKEQAELIKKYKIKLDDVEKNEPKLHHAITAPVYLKNCIRLPDNVVNAIRYHTTGRANMSLLEKIIYLADYIEPSRNFEGVEELRELAFNDINEALRRALEMSVEEVKRNGKTVHKNTIEAIEFLDNLYRTGSSELI